MEGESRTVHFGRDRTAEGSYSFCSNVIVTSKYTVLNFIPKNTFEQLRKAANAYFLGMSLLMLMGTNTTLYTGTIKAYPTLLTLVAMMVATAMIAAWDDWRRHNADEKTNSQLCKRVENSDSPGDPVKLVQCPWADILVGDILYLNSDSELPADVVPLACSGSEGTCYVSTASLDGETNLKIKSAAPSSQRLLCHSEEDNDARRTFTTLLNTVLERLGRISGSLDVEAPKRSIHTFTGNLYIKGMHSVLQSDALRQEEFLLRGSILRNTAWCIGAVVYTGHQTRMAMNSRAVPSKQSNLERVTNKTMVVVVVAQCMMALVSDLLYMFNLEQIQRCWYLFPEGAHSNGNGALPGILANWMTFFILYSNLMPISLYATMEACNMGQALYIKSDTSLYDETRGIAASVRSTNLCQELGQVSYIFSDKTGTLTQNIMELKRIAIGGQIFGKLGSHVGFNGIEALAEARSRDTRMATAIGEFMEVLAVAHTVVATWPKEGALEYEAESPDERALVDAAQKIGWSFQGRKGEDVCIYVSHMQRSLKYRLLALNAFTSSRKMMSVLVRNESGQHLLFAKGADSVLLPNGKPISALNEQYKVHLGAFSKDGLRTLVLARKILSKSEVDIWMRKYMDAQGAMQDREQKLAVVAQEIEHDFELVGVSAIEDKLQTDVDKTIVSLSEAGIKLWVLTGDKLETARNIAFSCRLLDEDTSIEILEHVQDIYTMKRTLSSMRAHPSQASSPINLTSIPQMTAGRLAIMVTGAYLEKLTEEGLDHEFIQAAKSCSVVIACRVSPAQKAQVVRMVRESEQPPPVSLAIGDGANDVPMIQEAQVGVGIVGREGRQAVNAADFSFVQFRFLSRLLLLHGRWNYRRMCKFILYTFWRNAVCVMLMFYYTIYSGYSGTSLYEDKIRMSFNIVLSLPIMCTGLFDRDINPEFALEHPELYRTSRKGLELNRRRMVSALLSAVVHSCILFQIDDFWSLTNIHGTGDYYVFGTAAFSVMLVDMTCRVIFMTRTWNLLVIAGVASTIIFYVLYLMMYGLSQDLGPKMYMVPWNMAREPLFWICAIALPMQATMVDIFVAYLQVTFFASQEDIVLERVLYGSWSEVQCGTTPRSEELELESGQRLSKSNRVGLGERASGSMSPLDTIHSRPSTIQESSVDQSPSSRTSVSARRPASFLPPLRSSIVSMDSAHAPSRFSDFPWQEPVTPPASRTSSFDISHPDNAPRHHSSVKPLHPSAHDTSAADRCEEPELQLTRTPMRRSLMSTISEPQIVNTSRLAQQTLPSFQVNFRWECICVACGISSFIFFLMGLHVKRELESSVQIRLVYDTSTGVISDRREAGHYYHDCSLKSLKQRSCNITVTVPSDMKPPIHVSYKIEPFYQSHYTYLTSVSEAELSGAQLSQEERWRSCRGQLLHDEHERYFAPCGLQAASVFNDTFELLHISRNVRIDKATDLAESRLATWDIAAATLSDRPGGEAPDTLKDGPIRRLEPDAFIDETNIAWKSDLHRYKNPSDYGAPNSIWLHQRYPGLIGAEGVRNEHFAVWLRPNPMYRLQKLFGFIKGVNSLRKDDKLTFRINANFPVSDFGGQKEFVLNGAAANAYRRCEGFCGWCDGCLLVSSAICFAFAIFILVTQAVCPRQPGQFFQWGRTRWNPRQPVAAAIPRSGSQSTKARSSGSGTLRTSSSASRVLGIQ